MSFGVHCSPDERFVEMSEAWGGLHPGPKPSKPVTSCATTFGWTQKEAKLNVFTSDVHPIGVSFVTPPKGRASIGTFSF